MPSPLGHVLGGVAVGSLMDGARGWRLAAVCGVVAALPDVDFLLPIPHRGPTHSIAAGVAAFVVSLALPRARDLPGRFRLATALGLAVLSHVLFDWLGQDTATPRGLMAFWPFTTQYYISNLNVFDAVDRRYWLPGFWRRNLVAVFWELVILVPVVLLARRGVRVSSGKNPDRSSSPGARPRPSA